MAKEKLNYRRFQAYLGNDEAKEIESFRNYISMRIANATYKDKNCERVTDRELLKYLINFYQKYEPKQH